MVAGNKLATEDQKGKRYSITERKNRLKTHKTQLIYVKQRSDGIEYE